MSPPVQEQAGLSVRRVSANAADLPRPREPSEPGRPPPLSRNLAERTCGRWLARCTRRRAADRHCFVMMPFGGWFDQYYLDVYAPAIRAAGLQPLRADEVAQGGCVVAQIQRHIRTARALLADLSGHNPNVCYEVGLAHALGKEVVLTAACLADVPFDLRHLRVIVYDVRDPAWAEKLRVQVTDQLKALVVT